MEATHRPHLIVGIDEAGYGPILGPLVVSAVAFEVTPNHVDGCLWTLLKRGVARTPAPRDGRLPILDSKVLYHRKEGLARLERSALAMVGAAHGVPPDTARLLGMLGPGAWPLLAEHPWYCGWRAELPRAADAGGVRIAAARLARDGDECGARLVACATEVLPEGHFNRLVDRTQNKAVVSLGLVLRLIQRMADARPNHELRVFIDRQGGREHYGSALMRSFEDRRLRILDESEEESSYELVMGASRWRVAFARSGESRHLPVAAASVISKYLRELLMGAFNDWWLRELPHVRPTAGYYEDGLRFLKDIAPEMQRLGIARESLVRTR